MPRYRRGQLTRRARKGFQGYPVATVALYGPDDRVATKISVGIIPYEDAEPTALERWHAEDDSDLRRNAAVGEEIIRFIKAHEAKSVAMSDRIIGCPHEEGIDYPDGEVCPHCPFWAKRDRWTGEVLSEN